MKYLGIFLFAALLSCKSTKNVENTYTKVYDDDFIVLQRSGCFGTCPIYELTLYANGKIHYKGKAYTDYQGFFAGNIDASKAQSFFAKIANYSWKQYPDKYPIDNVDFPQFTLTYNTKKISKEIKGNTNAVTELIDLTRELDGFVKEANLKEQL